MGTNRRWLILHRGTISELYQGLLYRNGPACNINILQIIIYMAIETQSRRGSLTHRLSKLSMRCLVTNESSEKKVTRLLVLTTS